MTTTTKGEGKGKGVSRPLAFALAFALALVLTPSSHAHLDRERPYLQTSEPTRDVDVTMSGLAADIDLMQKGDPLRHLVRHRIDPRGALSVEHREDASVGATAGGARWEITRLVEYKDENQNTRMDAGETVVRAWRLGSYAWTATGPRAVQVGTTPAMDVFWEGNLTGGPRMTLEVTTAGVPFLDEGVRVRPQDVALYWDIQALPERGVGNLHAIEGAIVAREGAVVTEDRFGNVTVGVYVDVAGRRAFLDWGGQAVVDRVDHTLAFTMDAPVVKDGNATRTFRLSFPSMESSARLVLVSAVEYPVPAERPTPASPVALVVLVLVTVALVARRSGDLLPPRPRSPPGLRPR